jgi:hypothetical protein
MRQSAYTNFFEGQVKLRESERLEALGSTDAAKQLRNEYNLAVKTSLFQIAMFGSKQVNEALAEHFRITRNYEPCVGDKQNWIREAGIYQNMRGEIFGSTSEERVDDDTLLIMLFRCTMP